MDSFGLLTTAASGMDAQRAALDVTARNVAAAEAAGPSGSYPRMVPVFRLVAGDDNVEGEAAQVEFAGAREERGSSVSILTEMISAMNASRAYEADASLFDVGKTLAEKTLDVERL